MFFPISGEFSHDFCMFFPRVPHRFTMSSAHLGAAPILPGFGPSLGQEVGGPRGSKGGSRSGISMNFRGNHWDYHGRPWEIMGKSIEKWDYPLVNFHIANWKITMFHKKINYK
jgi:hypothetical protein